MKHLAPLLKTKEAIVFDLDGTLMHTEPEVRLAINRAFIEALQQFNQRDELSGLQSLCAKFHT
jgi:phosphoglycolate phosphatase-like HAD superfamily hydrolase